tara:strand:+ start:787 stop:1104 length:318 start_codon:yes stop_codon:yes gene_type:complete
MYQVGQKVKISSSNDNENYDSFRGEVLVIVVSEVGGRGYDDSMYPQRLMSFETENGEEIPFSLYEYEVESIYIKKATLKGCFFFMYTPHHRVTSNFHLVCRLCEK